MKPKPLETCNYYLFFFTFFPLDVHNAFLLYYRDIIAKSQNGIINSYVWKGAGKPICVPPVIWKCFPLYEEKGLEESVYSSPQS